MSYEKLEKSLYEILKSKVKLIELNKRLQIYRNKFEDLNKKITNINTEKDKID